MNRMPPSRFSRSRSSLRPRLLLFLLLPLLALAAPSNGTADTSDEALVRATVERYLRGLKFNDVASLRSAFRPDAKLFFVKKDGTLGELTQEKWYEGFKSSAGTEEKGDLSIASLDVTGNAAGVKVVEEYPGSQYVDYLSLLRVDGSWWIVNKIYTVRKK